MLPNLAGTRFHVRSPRTSDYNCFYWAAVRAVDQWWEPGDGVGVWPAGATRAYTLPAYQASFATVGYRPWANDSLEAGVEKVAIFVLRGLPVHAARQLSNGWWTSKIGQYWDIEHESLAALEGEEYGAVACILARSGEPAPPIGNAEAYLPGQKET